MTKISFNAKSLGIAHHPHDPDLIRPELTCSDETLMVREVRTKTLLKRMGFANVECFPLLGGELPAKDVDT